MSVDWGPLKRAAAAARENAYAPYSNYRVGAALLAADGRIFVGCNVENASYGLTVCAERTAVGNAIVAGVREFRAIAVASAGSRAATPCGACRQVLAEFMSDREVCCFTPEDERRYGVSELLPVSFASSTLEAAVGAVDRDAAAFDEDSKTSGSSE